ncbi:MAG TPA: GntR family transcriptional regulator [Pseudogracilibacillus sp.]|nr:GntR family transcriptional regulator [Pseudogracilibacillus sp.]
MNLKSREPLYVQVQNILKERIITGVYPIDTLIPSEQELRKEFGVSMITIRRAVEQLSQQGYVEKRSGIGTTVLDNNAFSKLSKGKRFSEYLIEAGYELEKDFVGLEKIENSTDPVLKRHFNGNCYCMERLYTLNGKPYIHFKHYIPGEVDLPDDVEKFQDSLYEIMYKQGFEFQSFEDQFGVEVPDHFVAEKLEIAAQPLLQRTRFSYDEAGQVVEYSVAFYNTDMHKYVVKLDA